MHQTNVNARTNKKLSVNDLHFKSTFLVLAGVYTDIMSCTRDVMSCTRVVMSCARDVMSWARDIISCARHDLKKIACPKYIPPWILNFPLFLLKHHKKPFLIETARDVF